MERIKQEAKDNVDNGNAALKRWWSDKYKLPPNHRLFLDQSIADLNLERFEDYLLRREELKEQLDEDNIDHDYATAIRKEIAELDKILGEESVVEDDIVDKWERQLEAGEIPDWDEGLDCGE